MKKPIIVMLILTLSASSFAAQFEELDKPPEGAHKGQMLLGAIVSVGVPYGRIIDAEGDFIRNSWYMFQNNLTTKKIMLQHLAFGYGIFFEYMPVDYLGLKAKVKRSTIVQRTLFGKDFKNWSKAVYNDFSFYAGPTVHVTARKQWDFAFTPLVGYALGEHTAAPIAGMLLLDWQQSYLYRVTTIDEALRLYAYRPNRSKRAYNLAVGAELNFYLYFTGGLLLALGCEWTMNMLKFGSDYSIMNPQYTFKWYFFGKKSSLLHSVCFMLSAGYAFSN